MWHMTSLHSIRVGRLMIFFFPWEGKWILIFRNKHGSQHLKLFQMFLKIVGNVQLYNKLYWKTREPLVLNRSPEMPTLHFLSVTMITMHTCEPSRIIREPPGNAAQLPHSREWDRTSRMWKYKKKKIFRPSFLRICMVIMAICCWKAINS